MSYVLGCVDANCECAPDCCEPGPPTDPPGGGGDCLPNVPNCNVQSRDILINDDAFDAKTCCFGPWDVYINKSDGHGWVLNSTVYCLTDVQAHYSNTPFNYVPVLSGEPHDWDAVSDTRTPDCFWTIDPYSS
jgi:hypothetical protein